VDIYRDGTKDSHRASSDSSLVREDSVMCQPGHDDITINQSSTSLLIEKPLRECLAPILEIIAEEVP
jgi:hypothetical protein